MSTANPLLAEVSNMDFGLSLSKLKHATEAETSGERKLRCWNQSDASCAFLAQASWFHSDENVAQAFGIRCVWQMKESRESNVMSALAREFCAFMVRASGLQSKLESFMETKSLLFKGGNLLEEQKLEWTLLHKEYLELAEQQMEEFLQERSATAEEVAQTLHESLGKSLWSLPLLQSLDYESFAAQMIARASAPQLQSEALASGGIFGGIWKLQKSEPRNLERFLKAQGVPWILRRLHIFAEIREVCVVEIPGTVPIFTILQLRDHGFGVSSEEVVADGVERSDGRFSTRAWLVDRELHIFTRPVNGSRSALETCFAVSSDGKSLLMRRSASEVTLLDSLIDDEASWSVTELFQRSESTQQTERAETCKDQEAALGPEISNGYLGSKAEAEHSPGMFDQRSQTGQPKELQERVPPLMPCAPTGRPTRQPAPVARRRFQPPAWTFRKPAEIFFWFQDVRIQHLRTLRLRFSLFVCLFGTVCQRRVCQKTLPSPTIHFQLGNKQSCCKRSLQCRIPTRGRTGRIEMTISNSCAREEESACLVSWLQCLGFESLQQEPILSWQCKVPHVCCWGSQCGQDSRLLCRFSCLICLSM